MSNSSHTDGTAKSWTWSIVLLLVSGGFLLAQDEPTPAAAGAPAAAPAQTEMQKWIAKNDEGWQATYKREVTDVHEAEVSKLKLQYLNLLNDAIAKASKASDLDGAVALRTEQKRFSDTQFFSDAEEAGDAALVKQARATLRALLAQTEKGRAVRAKAVFTKYDLVLAYAQTQLTKAQRLEDALLVKAKRDEVAATWGMPSVGAPAENAKPPTVPAKVVAPKEPVAKPDTASLEKRLVGTKWRFPVKGQPAEKQWIEFSADGVLQIGWGDQAPKTWKILPGDQIKIIPFSTGLFNAIVSIDAGFRHGKFLEGQFIGQKFIRIK